MKQLGAIIFPGFELLDMFGPLEMLGLPETQLAPKLVAETTDPVASNQIVRSTPDLTFAEAGQFDILLVPGGLGVRQQIQNPVILDFIRAQAANADYVLSVCTGSYLLAASGVLDGHKATTNKSAYKRISKDQPQVAWVPHARWVEDGRFITSSGVSAGMDMTVRFIEILHGTEMAEQIATYCEYEWHRDKDWDPFANIYGL